MMHHGSIARCSSVHSCISVIHVSIHFLCLQLQCVQEVNPQGGSHSEGGSSSSTLQVVNLEAETTPDGPPAKSLPTNSRPPPPACTVHTQPAATTVPPQCHIHPRRAARQVGLGSSLLSDWKRKNCSETSSTPNSRRARRRSPERMSMRRRRVRGQAARRRCTAAVRVPAVVRQPMRGACGRRPLSVRRVRPRVQVPPRGERLCAARCRERGRVVTVVLCLS